MKELFKAGCQHPRHWQFQGKNVYKVNRGYKWLMEGTKIAWDKVIWAKASIPRHAFISWIFVHHRLPTKVRLNRFLHQNDILCTMCKGAPEDDVHLLSTCPYAKEVWDSILLWWPIPRRCVIFSLEDMLESLVHTPAPKARKQISSAIYAATIYFIWYARNQLLFKNHRVPAQQTVCLIKTQIRQRILFLDSLTCTYSMFVDGLLT